MTGRLQTLAAEQLAELCERYPMGYTPHLFWRRYRVSAGMAYYRQKAIGLSLIVVDDDKKLQDTLKHEYAHLLAFERHGRAGAGHGGAWQQAMRDLGLEPKVCHSYPVLRNAKRQQVGYTCQRCGTLLVRTRKLPKRRRYLHAGCGGPIKFAWTRTVTPEPSKA